MKSVLAAAALALLVHPAARAAETFINGGQLAKACSSRAVADENACNGYLAGVLDLVVTDPDPKTKLCPPPGTKLRTIREAMAKYVKDKPDAAKGSGPALVTEMVRATYPCP